jgi:micrococcal nuclease
MALRAAFYSLFALCAAAALLLAAIDINARAAIHSGTAFNPSFARDGAQDATTPHAIPYAAQDALMTRQIFNTAALRKHAALFTLAAGITAGGIAGVGTLYQDHFTADAPSTANAPAVSTVLPAPSTTAHSLPVAGEILHVEGNQMLHVRAHVWVAQFNTVSICPRGITAACQYTADLRTPEGTVITAPRQGQKITLHNLTPSGVSDAVQPAPAAPAALRPRQDVVAGPIAARVIKTGDGDTVQTEADIWPGTRVLIDIRIGGIDTPEKKGRAKCPEEAARAEDATAEMRRLLEGQTVTLHNVKYEKYGGRLLADIVTAEGTDAANHMIAQRLAVPYGGGTKSPWCTLAQSR